MIHLIGRLLLAVLAVVLLLIFLKGCDASMEELYRI